MACVREIEGPGPAQGFPVIEPLSLGPTEEIGTVVLLFRSYCSPVRVWRSLWLLL